MVSKRETLKKKLIQIWKWIWYGNSFWSYVVSILLIFLFVKFIFFPLIGLSLGTSMPLVAVVSNSMHHDSEFDTWWEQNGEWYIRHNINKSMFKTFKLYNGFNKGDVIIIRGVPASELSIGDVIVFVVGNGYPIIHRIVNISVSYENGNKQYIFQTKGDNNPIQIVSPQINEKYITSDQIIGKAIGRIRFAGYLKVFVFDILKKLK